MKKAILLAACAAIMAASASAAIVANADFEGGHAGVAQNTLTLDDLLEA